MHRTRFIMIGGFLGAGKTTAIARLAQHYIDQGRSVGLVTNDQAHDLVDTHTLRSAGFDVGEVAGACFCCKFDDLVETAAKLGAQRQPDVILAEPVGSCTDLVATVIEPLWNLYGDRFEPGPLAVLLKPEHGRKILREEAGVGFSPKAAYIFLKQIEEADIVAINKIDKLVANEQEELIRLVRERFPGKYVLAVSARQGDGFENLVSALDAKTTQHDSLMEVDYDTYAEGEAELGWLNCKARVEASSDRKFSLDELLLNLVAALAAAFELHKVEPAHLKVFGMSGDSYAVANLVGSGEEAELSTAAETSHTSAELVINARVATAPEKLRSLVENTLDEVIQCAGLKHVVNDMQHFRPGRPVPTHRVTTP